MLASAILIITSRPLKVKTDNEIITKSNTGDQILWIITAKNNCCHIQLQTKFLKVAMLVCKSLPETENKIFKRKNTAAVTLKVNLHDFTSIRLFLCDSKA